MSKKETPIEGEVVESKDNESSIAVTNQTDKLISQAIEKDVSVETMEKLLAMRKDLKAEYAKEQYDSAMAEFQADCPEIEKTKEVKTKGGQIAYKYAPIEAIVRQVKETLRKHGFSYAVQTQAKDKLVKSICIVKHKFGHSENYEMEVPLGNKTQVMSDSQVVAAASTFSKRYAFCNAFGILTGDGDNDGADTNPVKNNSAVNNFAKKTYCSRCFNKFQKKTEISQAEEKYSVDKYGYKLCKSCQSDAEKSKNSSSDNKTGGITKEQKDAILQEANLKFNNEDEGYIIAFLATYGITIESIDSMTPEMANVAISVISNYQVK